MQFQELIDAYSKRLDDYFAEIDQICHSKKRINDSEYPKSPSYLNEVIMPIYSSLKEIMRRNPTIKVPNPQTYKPIKDYYRIKVGLTTVGGFSVPDGENFDIYFTPLRYALPVGDKVKVDNPEQLKELILNQLKNLKEFN